jgi:hypothetical protein
MSRYGCGTVDEILEDAQRKLTKLLGPNVTVVVSISLVHVPPHEEQIADQILTVEDAAAILRKAPSTIRDHMKMGNIRAHKRGNRWYTTRDALMDLRS